MHDCWLLSAEGGYATSDVVVEKIGADRIARKHLAGVRYEDISLTVGAAMGPKLFDWMRSALLPDHRRKNGAVVTYDYAGNEVERLEFSNALIGAIALPALDAASRDAARVIVTCRPEYTRKRPGSAKAVGPDATGVVQKPWPASSFQLSIAGLDCTKVGKVEGMLIEAEVSEAAVGEPRDYTLEPVSMHISDLVVTLAETGGTTWEQWYEDFVIQGHNGAGDEKSGTLEYLDPSTHSVLFSVGFQGLGIYRFAPEKVDATSGVVRRMAAELYCEQLALVPGTVGDAGTETTGVRASPLPLSRVTEQALQSLAAARGQGADQTLPRIVQPS